MKKSTKKPEANCTTVTSRICSARSSGEGFSAVAIQDNAIEMVAIYIAQHVGGHNNRTCCLVRLTPASLRHPKLTNVQPHIWHAGQSSIEAPIKHILAL
jgi:hypothetical protein